METVTSCDGTPIAYTSRGHGPVLITVDGALSTPDNENKAQLTSLLA